MSNPHEQLFAHVDQRRDEFVRRLMDYVRHPSISAHGIGISEVGDMLVAMLRRLQFDARKIPTDGHPVVMGTRHIHPDKPTILLYGHYDVQPPDPLDEWLSPPFEPTIRDGRIYARGIADNKGQHFAQLLALETLLAVNGDLPCNVTFVLEGEEEIGSPRMPEFVRQQREALRSDLVITCDGPMHGSGQPTVEFGVRGVVSFTLRVKHAAHDMHSGNFGGIAPNPIWTLVHLLATMKNAQGHITIDGIYDRVLPPTAAERAAMANLPDSEREVRDSLQLVRLDAPAERPFYERTMFYPTFTINGLHGGYGGPGSKTVLPSEAFAKCDIRLVEAMTVDDTIAKVSAHVRKHAPEVQIEFSRGQMEPSRVPIDSWFTAPIKRAVEAGFGAPALLVPSAGGSLPEYVWTKILGVPSVVVPYGNPDEANHAPNENLVIDNFIGGIKAGAAMLVELAK